MNKAQLIENLRQERGYHQHKVNLCFKHAPSVAMALQWSAHDRKMIHLLRVAERGQC
jgi:hypothetical protein